MDADISLPILMKIARMDAASWRSEETNENLLPEIVRHELLLLADSIPEYSGSNCLLHDIGNILERTMAMLAALARNVVEGPQIRHYVDERIKEMEKVDDLSELNPLFYMDEKHRQLKSASLLFHELMLSDDTESLLESWKRRLRGSPRCGQPPKTRPRCSGRRIATFHLQATLLPPATPTATPVATYHQRKWTAPPQRCHRTSLASGHRFKNPTVKPTPAPC
jgi:hypothetical protein